MSASADISAFLKRMDKAEQSVRAAAARALAVVAEDIITEARRRCPLDTGALQMSHYVKPVEVGSNSLRVTLGVNTNYAAIVHENMEQPIKTEKNPAAQHKWLEAAIDAERQAGLEYIAGKIREAESRLNPEP